MPFDTISGNLIWLSPALIALVAAAAMGLFGGRNHMPVEGKTQTVLITGASEGMGLSVAKKLAERGANVILVSRSIPKLEQALQAVKAAAKNPAQRVHYIPADVSSPDFAAPLLAHAKACNDGNPPDIVWCVAGMATPQLFLDMPMASLRRQMDVNFFGTAALAHAVLAEWLAPAAPLGDPRAPFRLVMTSSVVAFYTIPGYAPYAPSKWALRGLADSLSQELLLYPHHVKLSVIYPGTILSPGFEIESRSKPEVTKLLEASDPRQTPDEVADAAIRGLERGDYFVTVAWLGALMKWGVLGGSFRNNWLVDTIGAWIAAIVWIFVQPDLHGKIRSYGKTHGHPSTYSKEK
ncbi:3-ketodihydrosphingosine reductase gsl-3 [Escovopsis weberi]|uniref:3-dehydrosphinganine reductase n=1 Tax=Escovopsis weberi TaxID=150374 RepID=A0A0M8MU23_ESCWE|nr:3-ketodihydrosphingosine reductase gsl-3 [Escovopsis weberi]